MVSFPHPRSTHPYHMHEMICGQPGFVAEALRRIEEADLEAFLGSDRPLVVTACGTSFHAAMYGAKILQMAMGGRCSVEAVQAYDLLHRGRVGQGISVLGISHSGETPTTNRALSQARRSGARTRALCGLPGSSLQHLVDRTLVIGSTHDRSWANTMSYTTQLAALAALAAHVGGTSWRPVSRALETLPSAVTKALASEPALRPLSRRLASRSRVTFLGSGLDEITALEAALKMRETCSLPASGYHLEQFLHGPFLCLDGTDAVVALQSSDDGKRASTILRVLARTGATVTRIGEGPGVKIPLPRVHRVVRPIVSIIPLQLLAYYTALVRRADPDVMRADLPRYRAGVGLLFR